MRHAPRPARQLPVRLRRLGVSLGLRRGVQPVGRGSSLLVVLPMRGRGGGVLPLAVMLPLAARSPGPREVVLASNRRARVRVGVPLEVVWGRRAVAAEDEDDEH